MPSVECADMTGPLVRVKPASRMATLACVRVCASLCAHVRSCTWGRNGGHELLRLRADFVARHAHAHRLVVAILEEHDPVLLFAALAADDAPAVPAVMPPLQQVEVFAACGARLCALVGLPFRPPVALRGSRCRALRPCTRASRPATLVGGRHRTQAQPVAPRMVVAVARAPRI